MNSTATAQNGFDSANAQGINPTGNIITSYDSPAYFLADCHLPLLPRPGQEDWTPKVIRFLRQEVVRGASLFIVGDLFDFWFEWRHSVPSRAFPVLAALHQLRLDGVRILYLGGNHDGHVGDFLKEQVGIETSRDPVDVSIDDKKFHIIHGDGLAVGDSGYRALRRLVRWRGTEAIYRYVHPDFGIWIAGKLSGVSRHQFSGKVVWEPDNYRNYALEKLDQGVNYVVMGHRHEAELIPHRNGGFLAVGDWIRKGSYGKFENGKIELNFFENPGH